MDQVKRSLIWLVKAFLGYAAIATPMFGLLYWTLRIPLKQLLPPYFLLYFLDALGVLMMFKARQHMDQPKQFRLQVSGAVFVFLSSFLALIYYFGTKYNVIRPESPAALIVIGAIGTIGVSVGMFFYLNRWLELRNLRK